MRLTMFAALMLAASAAAAQGASYDNLNAGIQLRNLGQWNEAIAQLDKAIAANDLAPSLQFIAHFDRGQAHWNLSHHEQAIADFTASLELRPHDAMALSTRARAFFATGKFDQAASDLDNLIAVRPQYFSAYNFRAVLRAKRGRLNESVQDIKTVLAMIPENESRTLPAGIVAWEAGEIKDAEEKFSWSADRGSGNIYAWLWNVLANLRQHKEIPRGSPPKFDKEKWPAPIVAFYRGEASQESVFAAAAKGDETAVQGQTCEANFYIGEWLLQHQDRVGAAPLIRKAADECPMGFIEWNPAQLELANLQ